MAGYAASLLPQHAELLAASAICPDVAAERGYVSADTKRRLASAGFKHYQQRIPGLLIPVHDTSGAVALWQYRPDSPRVDNKGRPVKYETPGGSRIVMDVPPRIRAQLADPKVPLWVTEGARKAGAAVSAGLCCVALLGVQNWRGTNTLGGKTALPAWDEIALNGRRVYVAYDSDVMTNPKVHSALVDIGGYLAYKHADVRYCYLPADADAKVGLDDYLAAGGSIDALITSAQPTPRDDRQGVQPPLHTRTPAHPPSDQARKVCAPGRVCARTPRLATIADLLAEAVTVVGELGVTGEARIVRGTYLTAISQMLTEPVSLVVKGASSGGKSYATHTTLRLFPAAGFYTVTAGSQRSLIYTDEEFSHRTIVTFEATALRELAEQRDGDMTAMLVRTLLSEGQLVYEVVERGGDGKMGTRRITKNGPTNLIVTTTTTADNLHHENETRLLSLTVDESEEQTRAVMVKTASRRNQAEPAPAPDLDPWHALFHWLKHHGEHRVYIPYAGYLAESAAAKVVRMRRDFGVLLGMVEAHAVLHQASRERDTYGRILATAADYEAARDILAEAFAISSGEMVKESVRNAVGAVEALGGEESDVTVAQVARRLKRDRSRVTRYLKEAADLGYLTNREAKPGRAARYRTGPDPLPEDKPALPDEVCGRTPAQEPHLSPQISGGCAGVRGGVRDGRLHRLPDAA
jgi:hypothetical protein